MPTIEDELSILNNLYAQEITDFPSDDLSALLKAKKVSRKALVASLDLEKNKNWEYAIFYEVSGFESNEDDHEVVEQAIMLMQSYVEGNDWFNKLERTFGLTSNMSILPRTAEQNKAIASILYTILGHLDHADEMHVETKIDVWEQLRDYEALSAFDCAILKERLLLSTSQFNTPSEACASGFLGGTIVHTQDGLRAIESLQVGDWIYTRNRQNTGEIKLQQITKLLRHKAPLAFWELKEQSEERNGKNQDFLFTTRMQAFWSNTFAWITLADFPTSYLSEPQKLKTITGSNCFPGSELRVFATKSERYGWMLSAMELAYCGMNGDGVLWDFQEMREIRRSQAPDLYQEMTASAEEIETEYLATLYDLEVDGTHTYFVSKAGVWVHDAKVEGSGRLSRLLTPKNR